VKTIKLGFVPAHREPFDEEWATAMRGRCLDVLNAIAGLEIVVPDDTLTKRGCGYAKYINISRMGGSDMVG